MSVSGVTFEKSAEWDTRAPHVSQNSVETIRRKACTDRLLVWEDVCQGQTVPE